MSGTADVLSLEPDELGGHTIDDLADYLERGREPADPSIDDSAACQMALSAIARVRALARAYLDGGGAGSAAEQDWIGTVLARLPVELRRGRLFRIPVPDDAVDLHVTEAAVRGLVREVGDAVPGLLVGAVRIGEAQPGATEVPLAITAAVVHGTSVAAAVAALRHAVRRAIERQAPFPVGRIDVRVTDLITPRLVRRGTV